MPLPGPPGRFCPWCFEETGKKIVLYPTRGSVRVCVIHGQKTDVEILTKLAGKEKTNEV